MLKQMIQEEEDLENLDFVQSHNPEFAISKGAVLFSYDHNIISIRKSKYTLGIKVRKKWNNKMHKKGGIQIIDEYDNNYKCENCFSKFITKNENLNPKMEIIKRYTMTSSKVTIELYKTEEENVTFCDERNEKGELKVHKLGEFIIDVGNNYDTSNRDAKVIMKVGGIFISVSAIYCPTNSKAKIICLYE